MSYGCVYGIYAFYLSPFFCRIVSHVLSDEVAMQRQTNKTITTSTTTTTTATTTMTLTTLHKNVVNQRWRR